MEAFNRLLQIMHDLRTQCPWDKKQTIHSLRHLTIEETYELADAIIENNYNNIKQELGDLLLHIVFYAEIAKEENKFTIEDVINGICEKLIQRHPHIYSSVKVKDDEEVKNNWEKIKLHEGKKSVLEGVPQSLPSMIKAYRIQDKARGIGFDWENTRQVWEKLQEELKELQDELAKDQNTEKIEEEFGDVMFALINFSRFINVNPDAALEKANKKFIQRFQLMEKNIKSAGKQMQNMNLEQLDVFWNEAKRTINKDKQ